MKYIPQDHNLPDSVRQVVLSSSDDTFFENLVPEIRRASDVGTEDALINQLGLFVKEKEAFVERVCNNNHQDFVQSVDQLLLVRNGTVSLTKEVLGLNQGIQSSTAELAKQKKGLVDSRNIRRSIDEAITALRLCLEVLGLANRVYDLLRSKKNYAALKTLEELQEVHLHEVVQYELAEMIQSSVPGMKKMIKDSVMADLTDWLYQIRSHSQLLGQVAFDATGFRRQRHRERAEMSPIFARSVLNSPLELAVDEREEFDVLDNEYVKVEFKSLHECLHIHDALGLREDFRLAYSHIRQQQKDLLLPSTLILTDEDTTSLAQILEGIAGFAIIERATMQKIPNFRSETDVNILWNSMCEKAVTIIRPALDEIQISDTHLKVKNILALFTQTMDSWGYPIQSLDSFLLTVFQRYTNLLCRRFEKEFREVVCIDDYMPMPISSVEDYDKVVNVSWFKGEMAREYLEFPCVLPFSQMYPLSCIEIRNFLNLFYHFADDYFQQPSAIDETLQKSLDDLLRNAICATLVEKLSSKYLGQIVQILINLEHFEFACRELETLLAKARSSDQSGPVQLSATLDFRNQKKVAEKRIFELVNSKIDDLVDSAEYDWNSKSPSSQPSSYLQTMTTYLQNIMNSTLLGLPREIKGLIYFTAFSHLASAILSLPLQAHVEHISRSAVLNMDTDVKFLEKYVSQLDDVSLMSVLDELRQTIDLLLSPDPDDFYNIETRMKLYARVDPLSGPQLLEKLI